MSRRALPGSEQAGRAGAAIDRDDPYWPAQLTVLATILLDLDLPNKLTLRPVWIVPAIEGALLIGLVASTPWKRRGHEMPHRRYVALALIALVSAANLLSLVLLCHHLLAHASSDSGRQLIRAGVEIWITNVLLFAVWYWEIDRGGPEARARTDCPLPDFLFPQYTEEMLGRWNWRPGYLDFLYVSFTNATAFSPTDTMPLSQRAKMLMLVQSLAALVTLGLVVARAVNVLT
jgi:uncharacterized membrane protein